MSTAQLEGILHFVDERQDGQLRDPRQLLRPLPGNFVVPRQVIREMRLRPGLMLKGDPKGRALSRFSEIEGRAPDAYHDTTALYDATALQLRRTLRQDDAQQQSKIRRECLPRRAQMPPHNRIGAPCPTRQMPIDGVCQPGKTIGGRVDFRCGARQGRVHDRWLSFACYLNYSVRQVLGCADWCTIHQGYPYASRVWHARIRRLHFFSQGLARQPPTMKVIS